MALLLGLLAAGCAGSAPLTLPDAVSPSPADDLEPRTADDPSGEITVAYPDEPAAWYPAFFGDASAVDLASLWGLPLYRYDGAGQLRPGLAVGAAVGQDGDSWYVDVDLAAGEWSDGRPVVAADVVATVEAIRPLVNGLDPLTSVESLDAETVRFRFDRPYGRWAHLLAGGWSVLPSHVLAADGIDAYRGDVPVSGGWFRLADRDPGRSMRFEANARSPLGPPGVAAVEVLIVPRYETALGLVERGEADVTAGHLALNPVGRAGDIDGLEAAAPLGGTLLTLRWRESGQLAGEDRAEDRGRVADALDLSELAEGLLGHAGEPATSFLPGVDGPWVNQGALDANLEDLPTLVVAVPRWHEIPGFAARSMFLRTSVRGADFDLIAVPLDQLASAAHPEAVDAELWLRRTGPRPSLLALTRITEPDLREAVADADASARTDTGAIRVASALLADEQREIPLLRLGVAQTWTDDVEGVKPSSWPGLLLWNVGEWTTAQTPS